MAFTIPTLSTIVDRVKGDLNSRMGNSNALIKRSLAWVLAHVLAGAAWGLYRHQDWVSKQVIPDTAETEYLARWARLFGLSKTSASKADGQIVVTAVTGSSLSAGAVLQRDDRVEYVVTGGPYSWSSSSTQNVTVEAVLAGADGNHAYAAEASLELVSPPAGVVAECSLHTDGITGGADEESDAGLLQRLLLRLQNPPQGGSKSDYELWAQTALSTVDKVFVFGPDDGLADGEVEVYFTVEGSGADVIPASGDVDDVRTYVTDTTRKPVAAEVTIAGPAEHAVSLTITLTPEDGADLTDTRAAIVAEIESMFDDRAQVSTTSTTIPNSYISDAIGDADGVDSYTLDAVDGGAGTDAISLAAYEYPTIVNSNITWS